MDGARKGFTFYLSFYEAINNFDDKEQLVLFRAIAEFSLFGIAPNFDNEDRFVKMAWTLIEPTIVNSLLKSEHGIRSRGCKKPSLIGNKNACKNDAKTILKQSNGKNDTETKLKQNYIDKEIEEEIYKEVESERGVERVKENSFCLLSDGQKTLTLAEKERYVIRLLEQNGVYPKGRINQNNIISKVGKMIDYSERFGVKLEDYVSRAVADIKDGRKDFFSVCTLDYAKTLRN